MELTVLCWNLFHGRDFPPDPELRSWRSRFLRLNEENETHVQVNRDLTPEFATLLASAAWDIAMLQECPPRFAAPLARASVAEYHRVFTSRNELGFWRAALARQNPDLMASGEGGSNTTPVRVPGERGGGGRRGRLEHAGGRGAGEARRDRGAARAGDPRGRAGAALDGVHPDRLRRL